MILQQARMSDLPALCQFYEAVSAHMEANGQRQWHWGAYPNEEVLVDSIKAGTLYRLYDEKGIVAAVTADTVMDENYAKANWLLGVHPGFFHRLAVRPDMQGEGLGRKALEDVETLLRAEGCDSLRCDTYVDNSSALRFYALNGMRTAGKIMIPQRPKPFVCFEKALIEDCPLLPVPMHPAFRGGSLTPWGGEKLLRDYDKPIQDIPTGESLEISCIPTLESTDDSGMRLSDLIRRFGKQFAGKYAMGAFPLLLKLIDAKQSLSVQVHPDNAYAKAHERGKLGKTEAWLILDAPEDGELVYGIQPGTTLEELKAACEQGAVVEPLLRRVKVKPGDVCYIPAGCVHAIGAGILLYEIQQSSDVTYRFYDWDRVDAKGNRRELHLEKALDVTDLSFSLDPIPAPDAPCARVLDKEYFSLDLMRVDGAVRVPALCQFGMLTALEGDLALCWEGVEKKLHKGDSLYLPTTCPALTLKGTGRAALSMPK